MSTDPPETTSIFDRFARFYDGDYRAYVDDLELILSLAAETGGPALELGCGTGRVLTALAAAGIAVTGVDISPALLAVAADKLAPVGSRAAVDLVQADLRSFRLPRRSYRFACCMSNTLMHMTTAAEQLAVLQAAHAHLAPGGLLLIDLFSPDVARLIAVDGVQELADRWQDATSGAEVIKWSVRSVDFAAQLQETCFIYEEIWPDGAVQRTICPFTLRFLWRGEAELMLDAAGFAVESVWGDFDGSPYDSASEHLILLANRSP